MTLTLRIVLIVASVLVVLYTIRKIRKSQLNIDDSVFWIGFSLMLLIMSIFPQIVEFFTRLLGIASPVNFVFLFVIFLILIKLFKLAIDLSITKHRLNHLIQRIAILNHDVDENTMNRLNELNDKVKK
ncbi:MAG: DUF2304 domain-containing protein [Clostridia bacterium]|nr:DUF2304 domain-containing protein [Clostridia bacterium]MBR2296269.1 DUF2304 domain-containing protein [Clostridia bacterium]